MAPRGRAQRVTVSAMVSRLMMPRSAGIAALFALLAGCTPAPQTAPSNGAAASGDPTSWAVPSGPGAAMTPVRFEALSGWAQERHAQAIPAFLASCKQFSANPTQALGGSGDAVARGGTGAQWRSVCAAARAIPPGEDAAARAFFEANFQPYGLSSDGSATGLFTGYYEPEIRGSRTQSGVYKYPLYRRPPELGASARRAPYLSRAQIEAGGLRKKGLEMLWLADPIDAFFLHIQGSGRVMLPDKRTVRVSYDGQNGQAYVPIGRVLVDRGEMKLEEVSMQSIRAWLVAHPREASGLMNQNPSSVFFRELGGISADAGPPGALGVPLSPLRSAAVDKGFIPLGAPLWVETKDPLDSTNIQRLVMAHDLGGAIKGAIRTDLFFGWGRDAEERAGRMRQPGREFILLPKAALTAAQ